MINKHAKFFGQSTEAHKRADKINNKICAPNVKAKVIGVDRRGYIIDFYEDEDFYQGTLCNDGVVRSIIGVLH